MSEKGYVFVYGTLKVGGHFAEEFNSRRISSVPASTPGTMYEGSGWYPACIFGGKNVIIGELHEYEDIDRVMDHLDRIEGCRGDSPHNLYNRKKVTVVTEDGEEVEANTYEYNRSVEDRPVIESGIWDINKKRSAY